VISTNQIIIIHQQMVLICLIVKPLIQMEKLIHISKILLTFILIVSTNTIKNDK
jgi:hypothetical protein